MIRKDHDALEGAPNSLQDKNNRYYYDYPTLLHGTEKEEQEQEGSKVVPFNNESFYLTENKVNVTHNYHTRCYHYDKHDSTDKDKRENDNELLQKYLGDIFDDDHAEGYVTKNEKVNQYLFCEEQPIHLLPGEKDSPNSTSVDRGHSTSISNNETSSFSQEPKKRKLHSYLSSTLSFPYKEGLPSWNNDNFKSTASSEKDGIWKDQGDRAEMLEKHFNSAWQRKFMTDFYGIVGGTCFYDDKQAKKCNPKDLDETHLATTRKDNTAILLLDNNDASKESPLNSEVLHPFREEWQNKNLNDDEQRYFREEDFMRASVKLMNTMDLTDESREKVFKIEESMNFNRTEYLCRI